jgi:hypothetical protein
VFTYFSHSFPPSSSPPTSDSDQTTFPQGRVYQEITVVVAEILSESN